ncbi:MAG: hypothetical protein HQ483_03835 [Rhodospirillales bacterium]|nr:hypothetical protein [Rhodospirillales bacterium]
MLLVLFLVFTPALSSAQDLSGLAEVIDGDTLNINGAVVELWGYDAPEIDQQCAIQGKPWTCGQAATAHIRTFTHGKQVSCRQKPATGQKQIYHKCAVGTLDIGAEMIEVGLALPLWPVSARYYMRSYQEARGLGRGMHRGTFDEPWEWRKANGPLHAPAR